MKRGKILFFVLAFIAVAGFLFAQADPYKVFNQYRALAKAGKAYTGAPLKGKVIGFANIFGTLPFCISVENNIKAQLKLAGLDLSKGWISMDNQYDSVIGLKNADIMLSKHPNFFIEFQADAKVNNIVAGKFGTAKIPLLAIDVPIPGSPFMGVDNWKVALIGGHEMAKLIKQKFGGWDGVDLVALGQMPAGGDVVMLRSEDFAQALSEDFAIDTKDAKIVRFDGGMGQSEQAKAAMDDVLAAHPDAVKIAVTSINEQTMAGIIASLQGAGRWDPNNVVVVTLGMDELGQSQIRDNLSDGGVAFFPERYGEYVVPAVCAMLQGQPVPPYIFVENVIVNAKNVDKWYPKK
jgi:ribose transport system substrate-binding protein